MRNAEQLIRYERARQIAVEGWTEEHDDDHKHGQIAAASECYRTNNPINWPWEKSWWKPGDRSDPEARVRRLVKAGALLRAERERLDRREKMILGHLTGVINTADSIASALRHEGHR